MARLKSVCDTLIQNGGLKRVGLNTEQFFFEWLLIIIMVYELSGIML